jgi:glucose-6-phosphate 1-dehydrogenase
MEAAGPRDVSTAALPPLDPHVIVLFGAAGDLARRKLLPAGLHLSQAGLIPEFRIVGTSLEKLDDDGFRDLAKKACQEFAHSPVSPKELDAFAARLTYVDQGAGADGLAAAVARAERELGDHPRRLYHLSVPPAAARDVVRLLGNAGLA